MRTRFDQYIKGVLRDALVLEGRVQPEHEIAVDPQRADLFFEPTPRSPDPPGRPDRLGRPGRPGRPAVAGRPLLFRMHDVDCLLEHFHGTPSLDDVRDCVRKLLALPHRRRVDAERECRPAPGFPRLWVLSPGRPEAAIDRLALAPRAGWPAGVLEAAPGWGLFLVVLRELPRTRDTLLLRLLGSGTLLHEALRELGSLPKDAWERRVVMPHLTAWRVAMAQDLQGLTDEEKDVMKNLDEIYREWETRTKEEGRREGRREGKRKGRREGQRAGRREGQRLTLMKLLTARFGVLSDAAVARIKAADAAQLDAWTDRVLTAASLPELLGDA